jgi:hypothetical protein
MIGLEGGMLAQRTSLGLGKVVAVERERPATSSAWLSRLSGRDPYHDAAASP